MGALDKRLSDKTIARWRNDWYGSLATGRIIALAETLLAERAERDAARADAATLAAAWADFLAFWPEAYGMDELTAYIQRGTDALAAHDALTAETGGT